MRKNRLNWTRVLVVGITSLLSVYAGVRTAADPSTRFTFRGQSIDAYVFGENAFAQVSCLDGDSGGSGKPTPVRKGYLDLQVSAADTFRWASTDYADFTGTFSGFPNNALNGTASCDATLEGNEILLDLTTWEATDFGPVTMRGRTTLGNPATVATGINTYIVKDSATGTMSRYRSVGKTGYGVTGTASLEVTSGGSGLLNPVSGAVDTDWSSGGIVHSGSFQKLHH